MKISVFGLGYVGTVSAACLANQGHYIIGVDPNPLKVELINGGRSPIVGKDLAELVARVVKEGRFRSVAEAHEAVECTEISLICVGTPSLPNGSLDLKYVRGVSEEIGTALKAKRSFHLVVIRSTVLPGTIQTVVIPALEAVSGKRAGSDFGVCMNPEFLREGTEVDDFYHPPKTVIGATDQRVTDIVASLYSDLNAPLICTDIATAEMVKYADNSFHALKIGFANEIGNICKALGIDSHCVMDIFCRDTKLNLSPQYLRPSFAFGGPCLPKDLRALTYEARRLDVELPILNSILSSNDRQIERGVQLVIDKGSKKIGILGLSFKPGTDDLRESPLVKLTERLLGKGYDIRLFDANINLARLLGANRDYIDTHIPHISRLMVSSLDEVLSHADVIVVGNRETEFSRLASRLREGQTVVDLVRVTDLGAYDGKYEGICW